MIRVTLPLPVRPLLLAALVVGLLAPVAVLPGCQKPPALEPVYLGHLAPATGPEQALGRQAVQGTQLAVEEANAAGGVAERRVVVIHADAGETLDSLAAQAVRLTAVNRVGVLLGGSTPARVARLAPLTPPSGASPGVLLVAAAGYVGPAASKNVFAVGVAAADEGTFLARYLADGLKKKRVLVVTFSESPAAEATADAFRREFRAKGGAISAERTYRDLADLPALAKEVVAAKPEAVFVAGPVRDLPTLRRDFRKDKDGLPGDVPILFGGDGEPIPRLLAERFAEGDAGVVAISAFSDSDEAPRAKEFAGKYQEKFGVAPDATAALAYDSLKLTLEAATRARSFDPAKLREKLAKFADVDVLTGKLTIAPDQTARRPAFVVRVAGGKAQTLQRYEPDPR